MALTQLQSDILRCLAKNRSETSYLAGGLMLNKNWQRRSDDIDIFHDTDEEVTEAAKKDIATLGAAGYRTHQDEACRFKLHPPGSIGFHGTIY
jgi:hypothetical protein